MKNGSEIVFEAIQEFENKHDLQAFSNDDVRHYFYGIILGCLVTYYKGYLFLDLSTKILKEKSSFSNLFTALEQHALIDTVLDRKSIVRYLSNCHRNLIIGSWNIFELLITSISDRLLNQDVKDRLLAFQIEEITSKENELNDAGKKYLLKKHIAEVPIHRKWNELIKLSKDYNRTWKVDNKFLEFLRDFRNAGMHSNFVHFGSESRDYSFKNITFKFEFSKVVDYDDPNPLHPNLYLDLNRELVAIVDELLRAIPYKDLIPYPDLKAQSMIK
ncbi:MAG: hypothetical protein JST18_02960 [Bacteroidetes bacterium]|nr:hypothetical protein [Bacteroidota bacterium]